MDEQVHFRLVPEQPYPRPFQQLWGFWKVHTASKYAVAIEPPVCATSTYPNVLELPGAACG